MAVVLPKNTIFLHVPKTGGEWIQAYLQKQNLIVYRLVGHADARTAAFYFDRLYRRSLSGILKEIAWRLRFPKRQAPSEAPFLFSFVRHPLRWYESMFKYSRGRGWPWHGDRNYSPVSSGALSWLNGIQHDSFMDYMKEILDKRPEFLTDLYAEYTGPQLGFVGRTENLRLDLEKVFKKRKLTYDSDLLESLPRKNVTAGQVLTWDEGIRREVIETELPIFRRYAYDPDE